MNRDLLAFDPLSPIGIAPIADVSSTADPLALDPLSPLNAAARPLDAHATDPKHIRERPGMKIMVIGASGLIGSKLVTKLDARGHKAVAASPDSGVDTLTGVGHHVALSVVGTERLADESGYFPAKIAREQLIRAGSIPYSMVHATQFFEFIKSIAAATTDGNTVRVASMLIQPIAADDIARAVGHVSVGSPLNGVVEMAGLEQFGLDEFIRRGLSARNDPREVIADPRYFGAELGERTLVPGDDARLGETRFEGTAEPARDRLALVTAHIDEGFFAADGGIELLLLLGGASLAVVLMGAGRFSADAALDLPRYFRAAGTRTRDSARHSPRRERARASAKVAT